jgi:molecular chaperone DnaK
MAKRALIVANSQYDDERFAPLPAAAEDVAALTAVLADPSVGEFAVDTVVDLGQRAAMRAIQLFFSGARPDDLLLLHLSLHGWKDLRNHLYFIARDTERDLPEATAISADFVSERIGQSRSGRIVLLLDCCYSGAFTAGMRHRSGESPSVNVAAPFAGKGRVVMTASTSLQFAYEGDPNVLQSRMHAQQPSVFTSAIVQGLRDGTADLDRDGLISVSELYDYVHEQVRRKVPGQTPTLSIDSVQGTIYLARSLYSQDADVLRGLRSAIADPQEWVRIGSLHLIERLLGSVREPVRDEAQQALLALIADRDPQVGQRARDLWHQRGLGPVPESSPSSQPAQARTADTSFAAGIDFGTTNSAIGIFQDGDVRMIPNAQGVLTTPSLVALTADGRALVGMDAKRQALSNPKYTVASVKLKLGTDWSIERNGKRYSAEQIAALVLAQLRADAEAYTGGSLWGAVLTVPAYFSYAQRYALRQAAEIAGINVLRIVNEPTAASMTYGLNKARNEKALIIDLGGGTFDVCLVDVGAPVPGKAGDAGPEIGVVEVEATAGDNHLGGDDWDQALANHLADLIRRDHGVDVSASPEATLRIRDAVEAAKIDLSSSLSTHISLPYITAARGRPVHFDITLTRAEFENLTSTILDRCKLPISKVIKDAELKLSDIDHVILVGGAARMPAVGELVRQMTGKLPYRGLIPEGIATGAVLQAAILRGKVRDLLLLDVIPLPLGIEAKDGIYRLKRNITIPTKHAEIFTTQRDNQSSIGVHVVEGEPDIVAHNSTLAVMELSGIALAPKGIPQIEITFDIDANGVLTVSAKDLGTGKSQSVTVNRDTAVEARNRLPVPSNNLPAYESLDQPVWSGAEFVRPGRVNDGPPVGEPKTSGKRKPRSKRRE